MSTIIIKDLPESIDLDRQAMRIIAGGARGSSRVRLAGRALLGSSGLVAKPSVVISRPQPSATKGLPKTNATLK